MILYIHIYIYIYIRVFPFRRIKLCKGIVFKCIWQLLLLLWHPKMPQSGAKAPWRWLWPCNVMKKSEPTPDQSHHSIAPLGWQPRAAVGTGMMPSEAWGCPPHMFNSFPHHQGQVMLQTNVEAKWSPGSPPCDRGSSIIPTSWRSLGLSFGHIGGLATKKEM